MVVMHRRERLLWLYAEAHSMDLHSELKELMTQDATSLMLLLRFIFMSAPSQLMILGDLDLSVVNCLAVGIIKVNILAAEQHLLYWTWELSTSGLLESPKSTFWVQSRRHSGSLPQIWRLLQGLWAMLQMSLHSVGQSFPS